VRECITGREKYRPYSYAFRGGHNSFLERIKAM
jgi:hypothetical protein